MKKLKKTITINRAAEKVFEFAIDPQNTPKWVDGIIQEQTSESPTKLGTIYRNQSQDGNWTELEITDFKPGVMFELTKLDDNHHVRFTFTPINDSKCKLEYCVHVNSGELSERFSGSAIQDILQKLKEVVE